MDHHMVLHVTEPALTLKTANSLNSSKELVSGDDTQLLHIKDFFLVCMRMRAGLLLDFCVGSKPG